jgi:hypothetical protein
MDIDIYGINTEMLDQAWPDISPFIEKGLAFAHGEMNIDDVYHEIMIGRIVPVVMGYDGDIMAVVAMEIAEKHRKRVMCLMTAGGTSLDEWLEEFLDVAYELAKEQNCDSIYINGRKGWERKLKRHGYNHAYTVLKREIKCLEH